MNLRPAKFFLRHPAIRYVLAVACLFTQVRTAQAVHVVIDYRYDSNNFFNTAQKRAPIEAAAARYSAIVTTPLSAATFADDNVDARIAFGNPSTGQFIQVSPAVSAANDAVVAAGGSAANEYRGPWSIAANDFVLYVGGRSLDMNTAGVTTVGSASNFQNVTTDPNSQLNRNFRATSTSSNLPMWGSSISFDNDGSTIWNFDLNSPTPNGATDLYSIALHEIGHALGLSTSFPEWTRFSSSAHFSGPNSVSTYNADNGASLVSLNEVSTTDHHWQDNTYDSYIFQNGSPDYVGTVGNVTKQDLLMEPTQDYTATVHRFELTNVDVAALRDVGWSTIPQISSDFNNDGRVNLADYVTWRKTNNTAQGYAVWRQNFSPSPVAGAGLDSAFVAAVPEPASWILVALGIMCVPRRIRRSA